MEKVTFKDINEFELKETLDGTEEIQVSSTEKINLKDQLENTLSRLDETSKKPINSSAVQKLWNDKGYTYEGVKISGEGPHEVQGYTTFNGQYTLDKYVYISGRSYKLEIGKTINIGAVGPTFSITYNKDASGKGIITIEKQNSGDQDQTVFVINTITTLPDVLIPNSIARKEQLEDMVVSKSVTLTKTNNSVSIPRSDVEVYYEVNNEYEAKNGIISSGETIDLIGGNLKHDGQNITLVAGADELEANITMFTPIHRAALPADLTDIKASQIVLEYGQTIPSEEANLRIYALKSKTGFEEHNLSVIKRLVSVLSSGGQSTQDQEIFFATFNDNINGSSEVFSVPLRGNGNELVTGETRFTNTYDGLEDIYTISVDIEILMECVTADSVDECFFKLTIFTKETKEVYTTGFSMGELGRGLAMASRELLNAVKRGKIIRIPVKLPVDNQGYIIANATVISAGDVDNLYISCVHNIVLIPEYTYAQAEFKVGTTSATLTVVHNSDGITTNPDWLNHRENDPNHIANRTHYPNLYGTITPGQRYSIVDSEPTHDLNNYRLLLRGDLFKIQEGTFSIGKEEGAYIGIICVKSESESDNTVTWTLTTSTNHSGFGPGEFITVVSKLGDYKPLDEFYLPDTCINGAYIVTEFTTQDIQGLIDSKSPKLLPISRALLDAMYKGVPIMVKASPNQGATTPITVDFITNPSEGLGFQFIVKQGNTEYVVGLKGGGSDTVLTGISYVYVIITSYNMIDWDEDDDTRTSYIANRTHYSNIAHRFKPTQKVLLLVPTSILDIEDYRVQLGENLYKLPKTKTPVTLGSSSKNLTFILDNITDDGTGRLVYTYNTTDPMGFSGEEIISIYRVVKPLDSVYLHNEALTWNYKTAQVASNGSLLFNLGEGDQLYNKDLVGIDASSVADKFNIVIGTEHHRSNYIKEYTFIVYNNTTEISPIVSFARGLSNIAAYRSMFIGNSSPNCEIHVKLMSSETGDCLAIIEYKSFNS